jgi:hypothetical protein
LQPEKVISALEEDSNSLINWFSANRMQANPEKFQAISVGKKTHDKNVMFNLNGTGLACILFAENQLIRELLSSSKAEITFSKVLSDFDKVLSSA